MKIASSTQHPTSRISLLFAFLLFSFSAVSCEEDDVCVGEGTPYLTVVFKNTLNQENLRDTLLIERIDVNQTVLDTVVWTLTDSIKLPLGGLDESTSYFRIKRRAAGIPDILTVDYDTKSNYVSKACGFRITYDNLGYNSTLNDIKNTVPGESNTLENEAATNLYIYYTSY